MQPDFSPWGEIDWSETMIPGIEMVATPSHGGIMVSREASILLSPDLCFEEDADENIVLRELLDQKLWRIPDRVQDHAAFEADINRNIQTYHPDYWNARTARLQKEGKVSRRSHPSHGR